MVFLLGSEGTRELVKSLCPVSQLSSMTDELEVTWEIYGCATTAVVFLGSQDHVLRADSHGARVERLCPQWAPPLQS